MEDQKDYADFILPPPEEEKGEGKPFTFQIGKRSAFSPPPSVLLGIGDKQKKYEAWLEKTYREQYALLEKPSNNKIRQDQLRRFIVLCQAAVKEKEAVSVTYAVHPQAAPKGLDIGAAIKKLVLAELGILYAVAPQFGIKTNLPVHIDDSSTLDDAKKVEPPNA